MSAYGCWNSQRKDSYPVAVRDYWPRDMSHFDHKIVQVEDRGSRACRYDFRAADPECAGCRK